MDPIDLDALLFVALVGCLVLLFFTIITAASVSDAEEREKKLKVENLRLAQELEAAKRLITGLVVKDHDKEIMVMSYRSTTPVWVVKVRGKQVHFPTAQSYGEKHKLVEVSDLRTWTTPRPPRS